MKRYIKKFFDNEILSYLFFGVATTIVSVGTRMIIFYLTQQELTATALGNIPVSYLLSSRMTLLFLNKNEQIGLDVLSNSQELDFLPSYLIWY